MRITSDRNYNNPMRRLFFVLILFLFACRSFTLLPGAIQTPVPPPTATEIAETPGAIPELTETAAPPTLPAPPAGLETPYSVRVHPDGKLYVGDRVSFEVVIPQDSAGAVEKVRVQLNDGGLKQIGEAQAAPFGIGGRLEATFTWAWDTQGLQAGDYELVFSILPDGSTWTQTITLLPQDKLPEAEKGAEWRSATSACCKVYYISGTEAERDLPGLLKLADEQAQDAERRMGVQAGDPITITLIPRLLGQGGFADRGISVSYLDRNYSAGSMDIILHHEMIHILDNRLGGDLRPSLLEEGLAVYMTGGHFKPEPLLPRAATLLATAGNSKLPGLGWYIPLRELADHFYISQHEIGYLEGAALVAYIVERWGWLAFDEFYRDIHPQPDGSQAKAIEVSLVKHFNLTLDELEAAFLDTLQNQTPVPGQQEDVRQSVHYYDTVRRYQEILDPSAYYLTTWLPDAREMRRRNIVADWLRRPTETANLALETLLAETGRELMQGNDTLVEQNLTAVNRVLDAIQAGEADPFAKDAKALDYYEIVQALQRGGFWIDPLYRGEITPQRIQVSGDQAQAWVSLKGPGLRQVSLARMPGGWRLLLFWEGKWNVGNQAFANLERWQRLDAVIFAMGR